MWDQTDLHFFVKDSNSKLGQINMNTPFGIELSNIARDETNKVFLEVGTWNGLGSTACIYNGLKERTDDWAFYSLETNKEKIDFAKKHYENSRISFHNETLLKTIPTYYDIVKELGNDVVQKWYDIDVENLKNCKYFFEDKQIEHFDMVLLDGGEYHTYFEFLEIKDRTKIICLDDVNAVKCKRIYNELSTSPDWKLYKEDMHERNGWAIFNRK
jgi:hypothetical protein